MHGLPFEDFDLGWSPGHLLRRCHQRFQALFNETAAHFGLTAQQASLLIAIQKSPGTNFRRLTLSIGMDRNTLREMATRLIAKNMIVQRRSARDPRCHELHVSADGLLALLAIEGGLQKAEARMLAPLEPAEHAKFIAAAQVIAGITPERPAS